MPPPRIIVQCESFTTAIAILTSTDTLAIVVPEVLSGRQGHAFLERIGIEDALPRMSLGMFSRADAPLAPAADAMADAVATTARRLARNLR